MRGDVCDKPSAVYRLYDADDRLLYVGCSILPTSRFVAHASRRDWAQDAVKMTMEWHSDRWAAEDAERAAIAAEAPLYNTRHNHGTPKRPCEAPQ